MCCFLPPFVSPPRRAAPFSFRDRKPARHDDASTFSTSKRTGYNETPSNYHSRVTLVRQNSRSAYFFPLFLSLSFSLLCLIAELLCRVHSFLEHESDTSRSRTLFPSSKKISRALEMIEKRKKKKERFLFYRRSRMRAYFLPTKGNEASPRFFPLIAFHLPLF